MGCGCNKTNQNNPPLKRERVVRTNTPTPKNKTNTPTPNSSIIKPLPRKKRK
jgi:hypothetical protein